MEGFGSDDERFCECTAKHCFFLCVCVGLVREIAVKHKTNQDTMSDSEVWTWL